MEEHVYRGDRFFRDFPLVVQRVEIDRDLALHGHDFLELVIIVRGNARHVVRRGRRSDAQQVVPGDVFVLAPDERHGYFEPHHCEVVNLLFTPDLLRSHHKQLAEVPGLADLLFLEPLFRHEEPVAKRWHLPPGSCREIDGECSRLVAEIGDRPSGWKLAAEVGFIRLLILLARALALSPDRKSPVVAAQNEVVAKALAFIDEHHGNRLSLGAVARQVCLSPRHFSAVFTKQTGVSPWSYLTTIRLENAKRKLATTELSVTEIAFAVGFADSGYFTRVFHRHEGVSPRRWRLAHRQR